MFFSMFICPGIFSMSNVQTFFLSLPPLFEKDRCAIQYPRIGEGGVLICVYLTFHFTQHIDVFKTSQHFSFVENQYQRRATNLFASDTNTVSPDLPSPFQLSFSTKTYYFNSNSWLGCPPSHIDVHSRCFAPRYSIRGCLQLFLLFLRLFFDKYPYLGSQSNKQTDLMPRDSVTLFSDSRRNKSSFLYYQQSVAETGHT